MSLESMFPLSLIDLIDLSFRVQQFNGEVANDFSGSNEGYLETLGRHPYCGMFLGDNCYSVACGNYYW